MSDAEKAIEAAKVVRDFCKSQTFKQCWEECPFHVFGLFCVLCDQRVNPCEWRIEDAEKINRAMMEEKKK